MTVSHLATAEEPGGHESGRAPAGVAREPKVQSRARRSEAAQDSAEREPARTEGPGRLARVNVRSIVVQGPGERVGELARALARRVRERPMASLAAAIGVGFLVGGALSFRAGRIALGVAVRRVAREVLKQLL